MSDDHHAQAPSAVEDITRSLLSARRLAYHPQSRLQSHPCPGCLTFRAVPVSYQCFVIVCYRVKSMTPTKFRRDMQHPSVATCPACSLYPLPHEGYRVPGTSTRMNGRRVITPYPVRRTPPRFSPCTGLGSARGLYPQKGRRAGQPIYDDARCAQEELLPMGQVQ